MTNKIVILQNSVELYEHYINDEKWEKTLSFPKGGLTYNISNGTIKFFAFEDYLYRNCLMSMQLPIYIVDEKDGIDDEYSDIGEIVDILDEIFPTNDIDAELEGYLTKREAELTYQPIGDYVTTYELDEVLDDYYTKDEVDDLLDGKADKDDKGFVSSPSTCVKSFPEDVLRGIVQTVFQKVRAYIPWQSWPFRSFEECC